MKIFCTALLWFVMVNCFSQISKIDTDRPDQTESAVLVPKNWIQMEVGFNFEKNDDVEREFLFPTLLTKYGLSKRIELRLITSLKLNSTLLIPYGTITETGIDIAEVGAKISLFEEKKLLPKTSLLFHVGIPALASKKFATDKLAPNFRFSMQHSLSSTTSLGYNLGCEWDGFTNDPAYIYTLTLGFIPAENWYTYIETFGTCKKNIMPEHNFDAGAAYNISNNIKVDISSGIGISKAAPDLYIAIGFSARLNLKK